MSLKTKDRCGKLVEKLEYYRKQRYLAQYSGNVVEKKQDSGFGIQESGVRMKSTCSPPATLCLRPTAVVGVRRGMKNRG